VCPRAPGVHRPAPLVRESRARLGLAGVRCPVRQVRRAGVSGASAQDGGFGQGPAQRPGAACLARRAPPLVVRRVGARHAAAGRDNIRPAGQAGASLQLRHTDPRQPRPAARPRLPAGNGLASGRLGGPGHREVPRGEKVVVVSKEGALAGEGCPPAGSRTMRLASRAVRVVRHVLPPLGPSVVTLRMREVGPECGALASQRTPPPAEVPRRPPLRGIDGGQGPQPAAS